MQRWSPEIIRYLYTAADYSRYYQDLARQLGAFLRPEDRVCDAGCGLGLLSRALLPYCAHVTAVDRSPAAVAALRARGEDPKLSALTGDIRELPPRQPYDAMVFCFFGSMDEILSAAKAQCRGRVIAVKRDQTAHRFTVTRQPLGGSHGLEAACRRLEELGIPYELKRTAFRFDQPFRSLEDARRFFALYRRQDDAALITEELLRERLEATGDAVFPWRLPSLRPAGILLFDAANIPEMPQNRAEQEEKPE